MPRRRAPRSSADTTSPSDDLDSSSDSTSPRHPQRNAANARERARMRVLSRAFCRLKTTLPWVPADTKLSKLDTLRLATSYIAHLRAVLTDQPVGVETGMKHPLSLTWPFTFQQSGTTLNTNCDSGGCWVNSNRDSEDEDYQETSINPQNHQNYSNHQGVIRDYAPYYQQYTDTLMHIG